MGSKFLVVLFAVVISLFGLAPAWGWPVPDTGQNTCYDDLGNTLDPCTLPWEAFYGQDGCYLINPPSYTKLDAGGHALPDSAASWSMVRDNVTGLAWEAKRNKDGIKDYDDPHDADNTYTWYDSDPATNGGDAGTPGEGTDTEDFIAQLNDEFLGGFADWRLPTIKELDTIVDLGRFDPASDTGGFPNTQALSYWSSVSSAIGSYSAWAMWFIQGRVLGYGKNYALYARAVRGAASANRFSDNGNGTVTDAATGLVWQQATARDGQGSLYLTSWEGALAYCEDLELAGYDDWRLPTQKEMRSLVDYGRFRLAIDTAYFPDTMDSDYWSSTTHAQVPDSAWCIDFMDGGDEAIIKWRAGGYYVRAVRGGLDYLGLVTSYYDTILGREPEPGGAEAWRDEIARIAGLGIDGNEGFIALGMAFFNSQEYFDRSRSNAEYVGDLYETFLQRNPSTQEVDEWEAQLDQGLPRGVLLTYFACSEEFKLYMEGLLGTVPTRPEDNLVNDFYRGLLHRLPDSGGFGGWRDQMRAAQCTDATVVKDVARAEAEAFFQCQEYDEGNKTDAQFAEDLYNAFLRRGADPAGFSYWVDQLGTGAVSRLELLAAFVESPEFQGRVDEVIAAGCLESSPH